MLLSMNNRIKTKLVIFISIAVIEMLLAAGGWIYDRAFYSLFLRHFNPILLVFLFSVTAVPLYCYLEEHNLQQMPLPRRAFGILGTLLFGVCFGLVFIPVDIIFRLSPDINILFPLSVLYYPVLGFIVDVLFHLIPLSIIYFLIGLIKPVRKQNRLRIMMACIPCIFTEPFFQTAFVAGGYPRLFNIVLFFFLTAYSISQLYLLVRYGFHFMLLFRYGHYLIWHILWGMMRLNVMF